MTLKSEEKFVTNLIQLRGDDAKEEKKEDKKEDKKEEGKAEPKEEKKGEKKDKEEKADDKKKGDTKEEKKKDELEEKKGDTKGLIGQKFKNEITGCTHEYKNPSKYSPWSCGPKKDKGEIAEDDLKADAKEDKKKENE